MEVVDGEQLVIAERAMEFGVELSFDGIEQLTIKVAGGQVGGALGAVVFVPVSHQAMRQVSLAGSGTAEQGEKSCARSRL